MLIVLHSGFIICGFIGLFYGGHFLVTSAVSFAKRLHISPLVIGLTFVAFGTSAPEIFVSVIAALNGNTGIAVGNVLGSNSINIVILGAAALFVWISIDKHLLSFDIPFVRCSYIVLLFFVVRYSSDAIFFVGGYISRVEGMCLLALLILYIIALYMRATKDRVIAGNVRGDIVDDAVDEPPYAGLRDIVLFFTGLVLLLGGAHVLVKGAAWIASEVFHVSERIIGLTIVAIGTSLPEMITTIIAAIRKESALSVGNILGSNIFNTFMVLGTTAVISPIAISVNYMPDFIYMAGVFLAIDIGARLRYGIGYKLGFTVVLSYIIYILYLIFV